jgi:hypothetical protein
MLAHPTLDHLHALGLYGLAKGFKELEHRPEARGLDHAEWLGLLLEYELTLRCSATIWMRKQRQSGWPFWRSRRGDDCRGATITQALFCREMI